MGTSGPPYIKVHPALQANFEELSIREFTSLRLTDLQEGEGWDAAPPFSFEEGQGYLHK